MTKKRKKVGKIQALSYNVRKTIEKTLEVFYEVKAFLVKPLPFFISMLMINIIVLVGIHHRHRDTFSLAPSSAPQVLASIVESSATVLAIFFTLAIFLSK